MTTEKDTAAAPGTPIDWKNVLPQTDLDNLEYKYMGHIEAVRTLDAEEALMFQDSCQDFLSMVVQQQFRLKSQYSTPPQDGTAPVLSAYGKKGGSALISPIGLERRLRRLMLKNKALRTSYYRSDSGEVYAVESAVNIPLHTITFNRLTDLEPEDVGPHLQRVMQADRHCPCRLDSPFLPRIQIYSLSSSEYAVIISQPLIIAHRWDPQSFLASLLHPADTAMLMDAAAVPQPSEYLTKQHESAANMSFWEEYLSGLTTMPELPGYLSPLQKPQRLRVELRTIDNDAFSALKLVCSSGDRREWIALLSSLWGLTLQSFSKSTDVCFPVQLPEEDNQRHISRLLFANRPMPCRVIAGQYERVQDLVRQQYQSLLTAIECGAPSPDEFNRLTKQSGTYKHILSFSDFQSVEVLNPPTDCGITSTIWHLCTNTDSLRINFHLDREVLSLEVTYYEEALSKDSVSAILDRYIHTLELAPKYWQAMCSELVEAALPMHHKELNERQHEMLANILSKSSLLAKVPKEQVKTMLTEASIYDLPCYEVVQTTGSRQSDILLLISGNVLRQRVNSEGWMVPLNIIGPGELVNEFALLDETSKIYGEVVSDKAIIVAIPIPFFRKLLQQMNDFSLDFAQYLLRQLDTYQHLWLTV
ncbi:MAG: condensation domain-containing protein [Selenomonadaceae bacterium]|nr:condensation domain-containing protein [Selenomonadaceae bacterium]